MELLNTPRRKLLVVAVAIMALAVGAALLAVSSSATADPFGQKIAFARIVNAEGDMIGAAILTQKQEGVRVFAWARGLARKAWHPHPRRRDVRSAAFTTAGGHFNPEMKQHGLENPAGPHGGDLPISRYARMASASCMRKATASAARRPDSLFDADGSALIIHAGEDDQVTDPTGNSGAA